MQKILAISSLIFWAGVAHAGDQALYQPAPDWVTPAPGVEQSTASNDSLQMVTIDKQIRIENGTVWEYEENAQRVSSTDAMNRMGSISLKWSPEHGDLIVHGVDIIRDGKRIDVLAAGAKFTMLRREANLEHLMLDGQITATLAVEGLRIGDVLDLRYSTTSKDEALKGNIAVAAAVAVEPVRVGFGRVRAMWPKNESINWKFYPTGATPHESQLNGWHEFTLNFPIPKQADPAPGAPGRFARPPVVEFSSFADWPAVSKVMAPLYATDGLIKPGSPLAQEVAKIAATSSDPRQRTLLALKLVQDKVRYFMKAMDGGNYVPQTPDQTWISRYGDCKAKTLLLLSILHELSIDAEPVLANSGNGDLVRERLPSSSAFDHVFVVAQVNNQSLWLDGTALGAVKEDLDNVPPFHWVLPVRSAGAELLQVPDRFMARPNYEYELNIDMRAGIQTAAPVDAKLTFHGPTAGIINTNLARLDKDGREKLLLGAVSMMPNFVIVTTPTFVYDDANATGIISVTGISRSNWTYFGDRYNFDPLDLHLTQPPDRTRSIWKNIPIDSGFPMYWSGKTTILLPEHGKDFSLDGKAAVDWQSPGNHHLSYNVTLANGELIAQMTHNQAVGEISPAEIPELRKKITEITNQMVKVRTIPGYPAPWHSIEKARREHLLDRAQQIYADAIASKPDEAKRYLERAAFLVSIFEREKAIADLDKALDLQANKQTYKLRAELYRGLGKYDKAIADLTAAIDLDPGDTDAISALAVLEALTGQSESGLARMDAAIETAGSNAPNLMAEKASVYEMAGNISDALATVNAAIEKQPRSANLLNARCWLRGLGNVELDDALKDCSKAIEMGDQFAPAALDSRAMVYFRQNRYDDALADLKAALDANPAQSGSLFMRGILERKIGQKEKGAQDIADAQLLDPRVAEEYELFGIKW